MNIWLVADSCCKYTVCFVLDAGAGRAVLGWPEEKGFWLQGQKKAEGYDGQRDLEGGEERYLKEHVEQEHANEKRLRSEVEFGGIWTVSDGLKGKEHQYQESNITVWRKTIPRN